MNESGPKDISEIVGKASGQLGKVHRANGVPKREPSPEKTSRYAQHDNENLLKFADNFSSLHQIKTNRRELYEALVARGLVGAFQEMKKRARTA